MTMPDLIGLAVCLLWCALGWVFGYDAGRNAR